MTGEAWVRAYKCSDCGAIFWGQYTGGDPKDHDFCKYCGGSLVLGSGQPGTQGMKRNELDYRSPFKPMKIDPPAEAHFICNHCGAPQ